MTTGPLPRRRLFAVAVVLVAAWGLARGAVGAQRAIPRADAVTRVSSAQESSARAAGFAEAARRRSRFLPGQVLVKFRSGVPSSGRQRALSALRSRPSQGQLRWVGDVAVLDVVSEPDSELMSRQLASQPEVEYAQPNYIRRPAGWFSGRTRPQSEGAAAPTHIPTDPDYLGLQWNLSLIGMPAAWVLNPGGTQAITVAVLDTGVTTADVTLTTPLWTGQIFETKTLGFSVSPDLAASRLTGSRDFVFSPNGSLVLDMHGHGTHVASTIAEDANNRSLVGIAYNVKVMPLKVCAGYWEVMIDRASSNVPGFAPRDAGGCPDDAVAEAIRYAADNGAKVINLSLGGPDPAPMLRDALAYAVSKGVFVAIAMGNSYTEGNPTEYPAAYAAEIDGVMSVGSVGKSMTRAYYSSTGTTEIAAPGGNDLDGGGQDLGYVWQVTLYPPDQDPDVVLVPRFDRYVEAGYEGTSMAAPHVAGVAALLVSQGDLRSPKAIEAFIKATAKDLGPVGLDNDFGYGLIQARKALFGLGISK